MGISYPYSGVNFLGFGENGNFYSNDNIAFDIAENSNPTYYFFKDFILNEGHTLTVNYPCRGLYIYVHGTAIINGTISMTNKGIYSPPTNEYENGYTPLGMYNVILSSGEYKPITLPGSGNLCAGQTYTTHIRVPDDGGCGGGGIGFPRSVTYTGMYGGTVYPGNGGMAGVFSSGSGGGGLIVYGLASSGNDAGSVQASGGAGVAYGGAGGAGKWVHDDKWTGYVCVPGVGSPTYTYNDSNSSSSNYRILYNNANAGVLYFVANKLICGENSLFDSIGHDGSDHTYKIHTIYGPPTYSGSGGTGGGSITVLYRTLIGTINVDVHGGAAGKYKTTNNTLYSPNISAPSGSKRIYNIS